MERFDLCFDMMAGAENGKYVLYTDHRAALDAANERAQRWKECAEAHDEDHLIIQTLEEQVDGLNRGCLELEQQLATSQEALKLLNELTFLLKDYVGETGVSEGAVDVLKRKLDELKQTKEALRVVREALTDACLTYAAYGEQPPATWLAALDAAPGEKHES